MPPEHRETFSVTITKVRLVKEQMKLEKVAKKRRTEERKKLFITNKQNKICEQFLFRCGGVDDEDSDCGDGSSDIVCLFIPPPSPRTIAKLMRLVAISFSSPCLV